MKNDRVVQNWIELQELVFEDSWDKQLKRFRSPFAFRGSSDKNKNLFSSLTRIGGKYQDMEKHILRNFIKYAPGDTSSSNLVWDWLSIAQHHGLPTRLLDWSYSPYVAMHFVTVDLNRYNIDGAIWCINFEKCNTILPEKLKQVLIDEGANVFTGEMLSRICQTIPEFDNLKNETGNFIIFLEPPSFNQRIVNQFALFSLVSDPSYPLHEWLEEHPDLYFRLIIPAELKMEIRDKLDQINITERVLFPGLDGLSAWLKRHYNYRGE